jgi:stress response protein YsnF
MTDADTHPWLERDAFDDAGNSIGAIEDVYIDEVSQQPEWIALRSGLFGTRLSFVPVASASWRDDGVHFPFSREAIKRSPHLDVIDDRLEPDQKEELLRYYSHQSGASSHHVDVERELGDPTAVELVRSEEEVSVSTTARAGSRVRIVKYVVSENVTTTVEVRREMLRLEHEPFDADRPVATDAVEWRDEATLGEVVLYEEEVVVAKRVVPRERVRLVVDTVTEMQRVDEIVRRERISVEGDIQDDTVATSDSPLLVTEARPTDNV